MKTFLHGGDLGDVIYALPAIRALGGGCLYLSEANYGREPLTAARRDVLVPLLEQISYLQKIDVHRGEPVDVDFANFRAFLRPGERNLAQTISPAVVFRLISRMMLGSIARRCGNRGFDLPS